MPPCAPAGTVAATMALAFLVTTASGKAPEARRDLEQGLLALMEEHHIPGLAAAIAVDGEVTWTTALGWADIDAKRAMTPATVLNVGSVSKLVTATAIVQLWEQGRIDLDADVNLYLPFAVRHPTGTRPITVRQLLTHTAGIQDGAAYGTSYACGDPAVSLEDWLRGYLLPDGEYHHPDNFLPGPPASTFEYSNVGYGLLGLVAQHVSGQEFNELTRRQVFAPVGMTRTGWSLASVPRDHHATPYWLVAEGAAPDPEEKALLPSGPYEAGALVPFCLYSFYNYPDGLLRTTIEDLTAFALATVPGDAVRRPLLKAATRREVFSNQIPEVTTDGRFQGLGWRRHDIPWLGTVWGHGGADPGIRSQLLHRPEDGVTVLVMTNRLVVEGLRPILELLFAAAGT